MEKHLISFETSAGPSSVQQRPEFVPFGSKNYFMTDSRVSWIARLVGLDSDLSGGTVAGVSYSYLGGDPANFGSHRQAGGFYGGWHQEVRSGPVGFFADSTASLLYASGQYNFGRGYLPEPSNDILLGGRVEVGGQLCLGGPVCPALFVGYSRNVTVGGNKRIEDTSHVGLRIYIDLLKGVVK